MNRIIYLDGSRSVGKTTLLRRIKQDYPDYVVIDGYARKDFSFFDMANKYEDFINQEKLYLACDIAQYKAYKTMDTTVVVVKGPITDMLFTLRFAELHYPDIDVYKTELAPYLEEVSKCVSDKTIYLDAKRDVVLDRYAHDDHIRVTMDEFMKNWYSYFDEKIKSDSNTEVIDTNEMDREEVYKRFIEILKEV